MEIVENSLPEALGLNNECYGSEIITTQSQLLNVNSVGYNTSYNLLTLYPYPLSYAYKQYGFLRTAIDQPIEDAFARGVELKSATLSTEELEELKQVMEDNEDWDVIMDAMKWAYLFGGGVIIADDNGKHDKPLNMSSLTNKKLSFIASDRWETNMLDPESGVDDTDFLFHDEKIDRSRVLPIKGMKSPYYVRLRLQGWGLSFFEQTLPPIVQYLKAQNVMLELLDESKIDILKINGLAETLIQKNGTEKIKRRVDTAAMNKNYKSMLVMDMNDDYQQKTLSITGLPEFNKEIRIMMCAYLKIPESKLWGVGASGFSSGQDMLENYNARIESEIRPKARKAIKWVADMRCMQLFGRTVPDLTIEWQPLRVLTGLDEQNKITQTFNNVFGMVDRRLMKPSEAMEYLMQEDIITMETEALSGSFDEDYISRVDMIGEQDENSSANQSK